MSTSGSFVLLAAILLARMGTLRALSAELFTDSRTFPNCERCPPGWGLVSICNKTQATVCTLCVDGISSSSSTRPHLKPCRPCSRCGTGLYREYECLKDRDTRCGWCRARKGRITEDFIQKCQRWAEIDWKMVQETSRNDRNFGVPDDGQMRHEFWQFNSDGKPIDETIERKPSYHDYITKIDYKNRTIYHEKAYLLFSLTIFFMLTSILFTIWSLKWCKSPKNRVIIGRQTLYRNLTEQDNIIIRQCAERLRPSGKAQSCSETIENDDEYFWEEPTVNLTENPLEYVIDFSSSEQYPISEKKT